MLRNVSQDGLSMSKINKIEIEAAPDFVFSKGASKPIISGVMLFNHHFMAHQNHKHGTAYACTCSRAGTSAVVDTGAYIGHNVI